MPHHRNLQSLSQMAFDRQRRHRHFNIPTPTSIVVGAVVFVIFVCTSATTTAFSTPHRSPPSSILRANQKWFSQCPFVRINANKATSSTPHTSYMQGTSLSMVAKSGGRMILTNEQFDEEVLRSGISSTISKSITNTDANKESDIVLPILVLFSAPWCGPCRLTNPVVKEVMKQYQTKIEVVEISTDDLPEIASNAGVLSIPTIQIYHRGKVMDTIVGCVAKNVLARAVDKVLEDLGMLDEEEEL